MAGRRVNKWTRVYHDGYDISGYSRSVEGMGITHDEADLTVLSDKFKGYLNNHAQVNVETVNAILDNTATIGLHTVGITAGAKRTLTVALGQLGEPSAGDPVMSGQFTQAAYTVSEDGGAVTATLPYMGWAGDATFNGAYRPFGVLLRPNTATTGANSSAGIDDNGAASSAGGFMAYHVLASDGTATISVQDAAVNTDVSFALLAGCTTGVIDCTLLPSGIIAATTSTVRRYLRWQVALGTASTVTFVLTFTRG